jgi:hypothetical protein
MNTARLREIVDLLLKKDSDYQVQQNLQDLNQKISEIVSQPQNTAFQSNFSQSLEKLSTAIDNLRTSIEPSQFPLLQEIGADKYFIDDFLTEIRTTIRDNPLSPAVAQQKLQALLSERDRYLQIISQLCVSLEALHIEACTLQPGDAEIGFLLPRSLFNNHLDQLIKELRDLNRIIRAFSEAATGSIEQIEVRSISTTDRLFFFHISPVTITMIAAAINWALHTWKQVEEIRRVRAETRKTNVLTEKEAEIFDKKIHDKIREAIDNKVNELVEENQKPGRDKEQRTDIEWALESILAHIERGMIVEIRSLPPSQAPTKDEHAKTDKETSAFETLQTITPQLVFPKMEGAPILKLPQPPASDLRE